MNAIWKILGPDLLKCVDMLKNWNKLNVISKYLLNMKADSYTAFYLNNGNILIQEL